jgi:hypothetical protein
MKIVRRAAFKIRIECTWFNIVFVTMLVFAVIRVGPSAFAVINLVLNCKLPTFVRRLCFLCPVGKFGSLRLTASFVEALPAFPLGQHYSRHFHSKSLHQLVS